MLAAEFVRDRILHCRDEKLTYLAVHNHGAGNRVGFSEVDLESHRRGYPALLDIARGQAVGALVFASGAVAGEIWLPGGARAPLSEAVVVGGTLRRLTPAAVGPKQRDPRYDRQSRLFGDSGQELLASQRVGIIGSGGVGSLLVELLSRLGVGSLVVVDPDRVELTNLPRLVGSRRADLSVQGKRGASRQLRWLGRSAEALPKVDLAARLARNANPSIEFQGIMADFQDHDVWRSFSDCDYLFLAADSMQARLLFNALVHQYLIPGVQVGSKVLVESHSGKVIDAYSVSRPVLPGKGCLWCNGLITPSGLQRESASIAEVQAQQYVNDPLVVSPSVITLNATAAAEAANDFLFRLVGLRREDASDAYLAFRPLQRDVRFEEPRLDPECPEHGIHGRFARGDSMRLPTRQ
jgi:hypothetical protein